MTVSKLNNQCFSNKKWNSSEKKIIDETIKNIKKRHGCCFMNDVVNSLFANLTKIGYCRSLSACRNILKSRKDIITESSHWKKEEIEIVTKTINDLSNENFDQEEIYNTIIHNLEIKNYNRSIESCQNLLRKLNIKVSSSIFWKSQEKEIVKQTLEDIRNNGLILKNEEICETIVTKLKNNGFSRSNSSCKSFIYKEYSYMMKKTKNNKNQKTIYDNNDSNYKLVNNSKSSNNDNNNKNKNKSKNDPKADALIITMLRIANNFDNLNNSSISSDLSNLLNKYI